MLVRFMWDVGGIITHQLTNSQTHQETSRKSLICIFTGFPVNSYNEKDIDQFTGNLIFSVNHWNNFRNSDKKMYLTKFH